MTEKVESKVITTRNISDKLTVEVRLDGALNAVVLILQTPDLPRDMLAKIRDHIKSCYGDEFNIVDLDSKPRLAKILLVDSSELTHNMLDNVLKHLESKLAECKVSELVETLVKEHEKSKSKRRTRSSSLTRGSGKK